MNLINRAAKGDNDPVNLLRQAGLSSLQKGAGYIVQVTDEPLPKNIHEWVFNGYNAYVWQWWVVLQWLNAIGYDGSEDLAIAGRYVDSIPRDTD